MSLGYQAGPGPPGDIFILCSVGGKGTLVDVVVPGSQLRLTQAAGMGRRVLSLDDTEHEAQ